MPTKQDTKLATLAAKSPLQLVEFGVGGVGGIVLAFEEDDWALYLVCLFQIVEETALCYVIEADVNAFSAFVDLLFNLHSA